MRIKVQDADAFWPTELCDRGGIWPGDGVISAKHNRDGASRGNLTNLPVDLPVTMLNTAGHDRRIAGINGGEDAEWVNANLQRVQESCLILRLTNGAWTKACPWSMRYSVIKGCADDGDVCPHALDLARIFNPRKL